MPTQTSGGNLKLQNHHLAIPIFILIFSQQTSMDAKNSIKDW
jgi:hypothetical protein